MSSGPKHLINNTRERLISTDFNRLQSFAMADQAQTLRYELNTVRDLDVSAGNETLASTVGTPLRGDVIGGLLVRPQLASWNLLIDAGKLGCCNPAGVPDADDSPYKIVSSLGVTALGALVIGPNAGAGVRIDVIECQPVEVVDEVDNRNIFDPGTGTFSNVAVNKVVSTQLTFRVRAGVAALGYPGPAAGWMPLAIASVPVGAASNDAVTFWDVRPLISDRVDAPFDNVTQYPRYMRNRTWSSTAVGGEFRILGRVETTFNGYKAGGDVWKTTPSTAMGGAGDIAYIDIRNAENKAVGSAIINDVPWYMYIMFPYSLPRWVRYTETNLGFGRVPSTFRGIAVYTNQACYANGRPTAPITLPVITGLTTSTIDGVLMAASSATGGVLLSYNTDGEMFYFLDAILQAPFASAVAADNYSLVGATHYPENARKLRVRVKSTLTGAPAAAFIVTRTIDVHQFVLAGYMAVLRAGTISGVLDGAGAYLDEFEIDLPLTELSTLGGTAAARYFDVNYVGTGFGARAVANYIYVIGWSLNQ